MSIGLGKLIASNRMHLVAGARCRPDWPRSDWPRLDCPRRGAREKRRSPKDKTVTLKKDDPK